MSVMDLADMLKSGKIGVKSDVEMKEIYSPPLKNVGSDSFSQDIANAKLFTTPKEVVSEEDEENE